MAQALGWDADHPAPTLPAGGTANGGPEPFPTSSRTALLAAARRNARTSRPDPGQWALRSNSQTNATIRTVDQPASTLFFGHRMNECAWVRHPTPTNSSATSGEAIRITASEAGALQSFPQDYPWQGGKSRQFEQIGNAVPPLLARHLLQPHAHRGDFDLAA